MHIVYLVHAFPVEGMSTGGAGNYVANIAQVMQMHGHKVSIITESKEENTINWRGIDIYYICATRGFKNTKKYMPTYKKIAKNIWRSIWYNRKVAEINKESKVDIVQSVNAYAIGLLRIRRIPYIIRLSSYAPLWGGAERENFDMEACIKSRRFDEELQLLAIRNADAVISPSYLIADITQKRVHRDIEVIESPVLVPKEACLELEEDLFIADKYFVTFGALANRKSIHMLAEVIDDILEKYKDMKYVMIGRDRLIRHNGDYAMASEVLDENIKRNKDRFVFLGEISDRTRLFSIVYNASCCILPTRMDNLPNTVLEAMALGKIVISSDKTSVEQLITDGYNGFLTKVDDGKELLDKVDYVMNLPQYEKEKIGQLAKKRTESLSPESVYGVMMKIYEQSMNGKEKEL